MHRWMYVCIVTYIWMYNKAQILNECEITHAVKLPTGALDFWWLDAHEVAFQLRVAMRLRSCHLNKIGSGDKSGLSNRGDHAPSQRARVAQLDQLLTSKTKENYLVFRYLNDFKSLKWNCSNSFIEFDLPVLFRLPYFHKTIQHRQCRKGFHLQPNSDIR